MTGPPVPWIYASVNPSHETITLVLATVWDWLVSLKWGTLVGPLIAALALLFTIGSFWWLQARQGKLRSYRPHSFGLSLSPNQALLRFPLVLYNTGPKPIVVRDMRLMFLKQPNIQPLPWRTSRSQLKPDTDDGLQLPAVFSVPGRQAQQHFLEFGIDAKNPLPGIDLAAREYQLRVEVLLGHKRRLKRLVSFPLQAKQFKTPGPNMASPYVAYSNDAVRLPQ